MNRQTPLSPSAAIVCAALLLSCHCLGTTDAGSGRICLDHDSARSFVTRSGRHNCYASTPPSPVAFAAGGFGGSGGFGSAKSPKPKKGKKIRKGKKGSLLADASIAAPKQPDAPKSTVENQGPKLDRFGLPIPTEADILPPLPPGTELVPVPDGYQTKTADVQSAMEKFIEIDYSLFDEDGSEKVHDGSREPMKLRLLHQSPPVLAVDNFFTEAECEEYIKISSQPDTDDSSKALKVNSATFALSLATRTSTTWFCNYNQVPTLLAKARHLLSNLPLERMEEPQLVRYKTGEEFSWHYDEVPPPQLDNGGQRVATLLVYLRTLVEGRGGATEFRDLRDASGKILSMRPVRGSALLFCPALRDGTPDDRTLHKGEVAIDEKMIGQIWVHERPYKPVIPEGNSHDAAREVVKAKEVELGFTQA